MYHRIVRRIALKNFALINSKDYEPLLAACVPDIHHRFGGRHPLGGERHDRDHLREWFHRLGRLGPTLRLHVEDVWVKGWPWKTTVIVRWSGEQTLPNGFPYQNHGVHIIEMRWGRIVSIDANEDSQAVAEAMPVFAAAGVRDATAPPILS